MSIPEMEGFASHLVPLISAVLQTSGPVCELGCGAYSTPILHELCAYRHLLSIDNGVEWVGHFAYLRHKAHSIIAVKDWDAVIQRLVRPLHWAVIFVDHAPADRRARDILSISESAEFIVVHDANVEAYDYEQAFAAFPYRFEYDCEILHTMVLSRRRQFSLMNEAQPRRR